MSSLEEKMRALKKKNRIPQDVQDSRIKQGVQTKEKLFSIIATSEPIGKSSADLRKETGLSRDRIHTICKEYIDEGLLYKTAKYGVYRLTQKALGDPARKGYLFCLKAMKELLSLEYICTNNMFCNIPYNKRILKSKKNAKAKLALKRDPNLIDKLLLFEFVLRIGSFTTLEMIMAIKFASESFEGGTGKDWRAWRWIDNAMNTQLMLKAFANADPVGKRLRRNTSDDRPQGPLYDMNPNELQTLLQSFQSVFPEVYKKSEDILSGLQSRIDSDRRYVKEILERDKRMKTENPRHTKF